MSTMQQNIYNNPQAAYKQAAVETASPDKLLIMLYTGAIKFLRLAEKALQENKLEAANNHLIRVGDIINELNTTLNMEAGGEIAANLRALYEFYQGEVIKANIKKDPAYLQPVIEFFEAYRDIWMETARIIRVGA
ncbi:flagellar export chaperone FliS [Dehalobacter sp. DCM]|uniref:flagellar export chaperone FliS n=1 Tax=Dehalobacter sp. DCM TaxID=2907827 RepID=UPI0030819B5E|nr:flagellar export chaperone FliS [Dehalobacter sp. DCM]